MKSIVLNILVIGPFRFFVIYLRLLRFLRVEKRPRVLRLRPVFDFFAKRPFALRAWAISYIRGEENLILFGVFFELQCFFL